jgi:hypothetical protein
MRPVLLGSLYLPFAWTLFLGGCGAHMDEIEMSQAKAITCESLLRVYYEAVDAGVDIEPEQMAIVEECF